MLFYVIQGAKKWLFLLEVASDTPKLAQHFGGVGTSNNLWTDKNQKDVDEWTED